MGLYAPFFLPLSFFEPYPFSLAPLKDFPQRQPYSFSNFGFWNSESANYADAALEFCKQATVDISSLKNKEYAVDVGAGLGGSSIFLASEIGFSQVRYINLKGSQSDFAETEFQRLGLNQISVQKTSWEGIQDLPSNQISAILVLDCFYHFHDQAKAIREMFRILKPGGRIAITDVAFPKVAETSLGWFGSFLSQIALIPSSNWGTLQKNEDYLVQSGFRTLRSEDWSKHLFPGFAQFCKSQSFTLRLFSEGILKAYESGNLQYGFYSAEKPG